MANKQASAMLIPSQCINSVLTSSECFRQLNGSSLVFAFVGPYLMSDDSLSATLTTQAFDLRRAVYLATVNPIFGVLNVGTGKGLSLKEILTHIAVAADRDPSVMWLPARSFDLPRIALDASKLKDASQ